MADRATPAKARRELEELYLGIPDDSVNLTFGDLAEVKPPTAPEKRKSGPMEAISEVNPKKEETSPLTKLPSLDFSRGLDQTIPYQNNHHHHLGSKDTDDYFRNHRHHHHVGGDGRQASPDPHGSRHVVGFRHGVERSMQNNYDEISNISGMSTASTMQGGGRRRPGIPHSNICTVCSNYIYICRHRCLVCGRAYCRQCVSIGMGEMTEGRKCIECLGRRFSQRYIQRAGQVGCCVRLRYPSVVMQQEMKWAEKGPRRTGERRYNQGTMMSRSRSPVTARTPITPRTPTRAHVSPPSSFVTNSPYSAYSPTNHPLPF